MVILNEAPFNLQRLYAAAIIAAACLCRRKPYQLPTLERQVKAARIMKASMAEDVRRKLENIQGMLDSFEEEVFTSGFSAGMEGFQVGQRMGPSEGEDDFLWKNYGAGPRHREHDRRAAQADRCSS